jgi:hypothetical protein
MYVLVPQFLCKLSESNNTFFIRETNHWLSFLILWISKVYVYNRLFSYYLIFRRQFVYFLETYVTWWLGARTLGSNYIGSFQTLSVNDNENFLS